MVTSIAAGFVAMAPSAPVLAAHARPSIVIITVDALRADRLGSYGYSRETSPEIDRLVGSGRRFDRAWTPEPLTGPAMCSMVTGLEPHHHGASRNGLRMQSGLDSLPRILAREGWQTAAFVGSWTLKDNLTLLGEHFDTYGERLRSRRWFGLINKESKAEDVTEDAIDWMEANRRSHPDDPFMLWVHYIEPHAPYIFQRDYAGRLGIGGQSVSKRDRYDTEIAAVDAEIGRLVREARRYNGDREMIIVFTADHGESLGEHHYWGHGRYLYEPSLRIPLAIVWDGVIAPGSVAGQASLLDLKPTILDLVGLPVAEALPGLSWADTLRGGAEPVEASRCYQAHKGAVHGSHDSDRARSKGLLWVGVIEGHRKELYRVSRQVVQVFDLEADPGELESLASADAAASEELLACLASVSDGLGSLDRLTTQRLDDETVERLRALGYLE
jgi:arylsulfatase A-like enzyme